MLPNSEEIDGSNCKQEDNEKLRPSPLHTHIDKIAKSFRSRSRTRFLMRKLGGLFLLAALSRAAPLASNLQPVIGVLTIPSSPEDDAMNYSTVDSSYVKFLQGGGAVVVPILFNATEDELSAQLAQLSGIFFTGGPAKPTSFPRYFSTASLLMEQSRRLGMPLWGTCLGFQTISDISAGGEDILDNFDSEDMSLGLNPTSDAENSRLLGSAPPDILDLLLSSNFTTNWHMYGVTPATFSTSVAPSGMIALSTNQDRAGKSFVSTLEHEELPIYAVQWHPEANSYDRDHISVDHSPDAVRVMQYIANFFVTEARDKGLGPGDVNVSKVIDDYPINSGRFVFS